MAAEDQGSGEVQRAIRRSRGGTITATDDSVAVEAPLELRIGDEPAVILMRTPGQDLDLARGLAFAEGWYEDPSATIGITRPPPETLRKEERGNVLSLDLPPGGRPPAKRALMSRSSCGVCGKTAISEIAMRAEPIAAGEAVASSVVVSLPETLRRQQRLFHHTGGIHAAGLFSRDGNLLSSSEDVGRHNAVDKVIGRALLEGRIPATEIVLCVSGRLSFEIVQKALMARIAVVIAVSAPTSLAIDIAERFRITLCGFVRGTNFNIYSHPSRITPGS